MAESAQRIAPRPLGTRRVSKPDQRFDWQNRNPEYLHQMLMQAKTDAKTQGMGFVEAVKLFLKKSREMDNGST